MRGMKQLLFSFFKLYWLIDEGMKDSHYPSRPRSAAEPPWLEKSCLYAP